MKLLVITRKRFKNFELNDEEELQQPDYSNDASQLPSGVSQELYIKKIIIRISLFLTFFQLCYRISERGISLLLAFLKSLLSWFCSLCPESLTLTLTLRLLAENMPMNVYFLKKLVGGERDITMFVSCPKCHSIYKYKDCIVHRNRQNESLRCTYMEFPNHPHIMRRVQCDTLLLKGVRQGSQFKLVPRKVYAYISLKTSLSQLCSQTDFLQKCEHWRNCDMTQGILTDVYDGAIWKAFQVVDNKPFLQVPNNLCMKLNLDWFNPFEHIQYSVGVIYLVVENIPRSERYKLENIIIVGTIPGPKEPKNNINSYLKPLIDELIILWKGSILKTTSLFGITPIRCALTCFTCDLPATRKICGFKSFSSLHGCSKCLKEFPCAKFGEKSDYSGYNRDEWQHRTHKEHQVMAANTATKRDELEKKYGVRYSELLRLPYFIVEFHVVDPMHNLLLGTAKHITTLWKNLDLLTNNDLCAIQEKVDNIKVLAKLGRISHKISSNFSSLTADQWKIGYSYTPSTRCMEYFLWNTIPVGACLWMLVTIYCNHQFLCLI